MYLENSCRSCEQAGGGAQSTKKGCALGDNLGGKNPGEEVHLVQAPDNPL